MEFREHIFEFEPDYDGRVVATLTYTKACNNSGKAILYLHGYTDYFFQQHLAKRFVEAGYNFYAIDLRKYGRSIMEGQHPNFCSSMSEYFPEITTSLEFIAKEGNNEIVLIGHSTGGLLASIYMEYGSARGLVSKMVLNSPFFEFNTTSFKRNVIIPIAGALSRLFPFLHSKPELSPNYARSVHRDYHGEWEFDTKLKPIEGFPLYFSWINAVREAQKNVHKGLHITVPILVMCSWESVNSKKWSDKYLVADGVLNVEDIARYAVKLGDDVELVKIEGGMHDLFLSAPQVREHVFEVMLNFLK